MKQVRGINGNSDKRKFLKMGKKAIVFATSCLCISVCFNSCGFGAVNYNIFLNANQLNKDSTSLKTWKYVVSSTFPKISDYGDYIKVDVKEADLFLTNPGKPILPYYSVVAKFPLGTEIINITCTHSNPQIIHLNKKPMLAPQFPYVNNNNFSQNDNFKELMPSDNEAYPEDWYQYRTGGGIDKGMRVAFSSICIYPIRYLSDENILLFIDSADLTVTYKTEISSLASTEQYHLVIIAPSEYKEVLQPLVDHKNSYGLSAKLVTLDDIYTGGYFSVQGRDNAEKIKYFIKDAVEQWGSNYILLVGSVDKLPMRRVWMGAVELLSDLYYADLYFSNGSFCSWDSNNNGYYGEYWHDGNNDLVDLYPDMYLGRLACANKNEVRTVVNKIISYEKTTYGKDWFHRIILVGGDTFPKNDGYEGETTMGEIAENMPGFTPIKLFASDNSFTARSLNKAMNQGAGFVAYAGHGNENDIGTHPPDSEKWISYKPFNLLGLWNKNKLPVIFFDACLTARLDYHLKDIHKVSALNISLPCFAWRFVSKPNGGAIATIGATTGGPDTDDYDYLQIHFFKAYDGSDTRLGEMFIHAQNDYLTNLTLDWRNIWTFEHYVLLGDPSLEIGGYHAT